MKTDPMIEKKIDELLSVMSLTEKVGQLNQISSPRQDDEEIFEMLRQGKIGSFIMFCPFFIFSIKSLVSSSVFIFQP